MPQGCPSGKAPRWLVSGRHNNARWYQHHPDTYSNAYAANAYAANAYAANAYSNAYTNTNTNSYTNSNANAYTVYKR